MIEQQSKSSMGAPSIPDAIRLVSSFGFFRRIADSFVDLSDAFVDHVEQLVEDDFSDLPPSPIRSCAPDGYCAHENETVTVIVFSSRSCPAMCFEDASDVESSCSSRGESQGATDTEIVFSPCFDPDMFPPTTDVLNDSRDDQFKMFAIPSISVDHLVPRQQIMGDLSVVLTPMIELKGNHSIHLSGTLHADYPFIAAVPDQFDMDSISNAGLPVHPFSDHGLWGLGGAFVSPDSAFTF
jgi:hypothetical protein